MGKLIASYRLWAELVLSARVSVAALVVGGILLIYPDQVRDLLAQIAKSGSLVDRLAFVVGVFYWAMVVHYAARFPIKYGWPSQEGPPKWVPRALGILCFCAAGLAVCVVDGGGGRWLMLGMLGVALGLFYVYVIRRSLFVGYLNAHLAVGGTFERILRHSPFLDRAPKVFWEDLRKFILPIIGAFLVGQLLFIWSLFNSVNFANHFSPALLLLLLVASWVPLFAVLAFLADRFRLPLIAVFVVVAAIERVSLDDPHKIQVIEAPVQRPDLAGAIGQWEGAAAPGRLVIVATAGGGSTAAFWTGTVLGSLQDADPSFKAKLFAISGVSGGSLGGAITAALFALDRRPECPRPAWGQGGGDGSYRICAQAIAQTDFLSPTMTAYAYREAAYPFLAPFYTIFGQPYFDRAAVISYAFDRAWCSAFNDGSVSGCKGREAGPFAATFVSQKWRPALLLNGTSVETGRRIVTSDIRFLGSAPPDVAAASDRRLHLTDAYDFHAMLEYPKPLGPNGSGTRDVTLGTAVTNSGRFPYVLPAGTILGSDQKVYDRIVDGGYIENFGALTAEELLKSIITGGFLQGLYPHDPDPARRVIIVQISSDPELQELLPTPPMEVRSSFDFTDGLLSPPEALNHARQARGVLAASSLERFARLNHASFFHFRLYSVEGESDAPLSWMLSESSARHIDEQLGQDGNKQALDCLVRALGGVDPCEKAIGNPGRSLAKK